MKVLSLFSGVGGFDMGLEAAGMTTAFQCEIDKNARSVLDYHWPDVPKWDDVTTLTGAYILEQTGGVDLVAWGSPCQDLSLAGKRAGLSGERSGLFHEGIRIIKELRELSNGQSPTWSIWENVYGALSSNRGADFGQVLYEMDEAGACFSEWAVLDAQYFGVPQRRRRVFVASCFDLGVSEQCRSPLFPVSESVSRYLAPRITQGEGVAGTVAESVGTGSQWAAGTNRDGVLTTSVTAKWHKGTGGQAVAYSIREDAKANNFSATEIETARALQALQPSVQSHHAQTFITQPLLLDGRRVDDVRVYTEPVQTLQERMGTGGNNVPVVAQETFVKSRRAQSSTDVETWIESDVSPTLNVFDVGDTRATTAIIGTDIVGSLAARDFKGVGNQYVAKNKLIVEPTLIVRRLTPLECERLMGWPDNHTAIGTNGKISDTNRYKMCGNGVASPVAQWLATHILNNG